jgi:hypothetical protein
MVQSSSRAFNILLHQFQVCITSRGMSNNCNYAKTSRSLAEGKQTFEFTQDLMT